MPRWECRFTDPVAISSSVAVSATLNSRKYRQTTTSRWRRGSRCTASNETHSSRATTASSDSASAPRPGPPKAIRSRIRSRTPERHRLITADRRYEGAAARSRSRPSAHTTRRKRPARRPRPATGRRASSMRDGGDRHSADGTGCRRHHHGSARRSPTRPRRRAGARRSVPSRAMWSRSYITVAWKATWLTSTGNQPTFAAPYFRCAIDNTADDSLPSGQTSRAAR